MTATRDDSHDPELQQSRLTAYALGQLDAQQAKRVEAQLKDDAEARRVVSEVRLLSQSLLEVSAMDEMPKGSDELRQAVSERLDQVDKVMPSESAANRRRWRGRVRMAAAVAVSALIAATFAVFVAKPQAELEEAAVLTNASDADEEASHAREYEQGQDAQGRRDFMKQEGSPDDGTWAVPADPNSTVVAESFDGGAYGGSVKSDPTKSAQPVRPTTSASRGAQPSTPDPSGYEYRERAPGRESKLAATGSQSAGSIGAGGFDAGGDADAYGIEPGYGGMDEGGDGEQYDQIVENPFLPVDSQHARSTFSIDVDTASYANVRRFLTRTMLPPPNAVRIEEMINYFRYDYPQPEGDIPFSINMEVAECPWQPAHRLLRVGLKGREIEQEERPASNLVFLLDVSGSMRSADKLPLLQQAMRMLVRELTENDRVTIATYAGNAGLRLDATTGDQQDRILGVIDSLTAGGSTHGSAGIQLAYEKAVENFIEGGTNRVILATDGDLNVGITEDNDLVKLIKDKAASGVFLTVLGFGTGNLKDSKMEKLADNGNGLYAYIDSLREARKVLVEQIAGSLVTIAKDVKIQIEFNPAEVQSYRLIGYENRLLAREDFDDDTKDAGDIGAGHTVTALYELVPAGAEVKTDRNAADLKYQKPPVGAKKAELSSAAASGELLTLWLRYKQPDADASRRLEFTVKDREAKFNRASHDFQFAAAVAGFGMLLRGSEHQGAFSYSAIQEIAASAIGKDPGGYRAEFVELVRKAEQLGR